MLKHIKLKSALLWSILLLAALFNACDNDKDDKSAKVELNSFGPSVLRGGELKFIGNNLNKVTAIILPGDVEIQASSFKTQSATLITIDVPHEAVEGLVTLKTPSGDIVTKTELSILEPITVTKIPTTAARPGDVIIIEGTYLNLISEVIFETAQSVTEFESQSETALSIRVPAAAKSGKLILLDKEEIPNSIQTEAELLITLPTITKFSPTTVKAGNKITIEGTNLDLVTAVELGGNQNVKRADFLEGATASKIEITVPASTADGNISLVTASQVKVYSANSLTMMVPTISGITPNPAKTGGDITVTGTDLDLVNTVTFTGDKNGTIKSGGTATSIMVTIPADAKSGTVKFQTKANKSVTSNEVTMVKPSIVTISSSVRLNEDITITGTNLDLVKTVKLSGGTTGTIKVPSSTATQLVATVPPGTTTGRVTLVANNGDEVVSTTDLTILAEVPLFNAFPASAKTGTLLSLTGTKLNLTNEVIFPGNVKAVKFGDRTATLLQVYVPEATTIGTGKITFTTYGTDFTQSTDINFVELTAVKDPALVFFDFNNVVNINYDKGVWWGDATVENDANISLDGSGYARINRSYSAWSGFFWRNGKDHFPGSTIGTHVNDYVVKFDINIIAPITAGTLLVTMKVSGTGFDAMIGPGAPNPTVLNATNGSWITISVPLSSFHDGYGWGSNTITDFSAVDGDFGMAFSNGSATVNVAIDNVRFEHK
jgi:hypothetical protein